MTYTLRIHAATEGGLAEALRRELRALGYLDYDESPFSVEYDVDVEDGSPFDDDPMCPSDRLVPITADDGWIRHDGGECPVHPMDMVVWISGDYPAPAKWVAWDLFHGYYRPLRDEDGVPYCSDDGLQDDTEYVATDMSGKAYGWSACPVVNVRTAEWDHGIKKNRITHRVDDQFANTHEHWTNTLRRVWRKE